MWDFLFSFARPPLVCSSRFTCLDYSPAPGRGMCERLSNLRLRAWRRSVCLLPCCAALSLPLVRYSGTVRPVWSCCLAVPSMPFRHLPRRSVPRLRADAAMLGSASRLPHRLAVRSPFPRPAILSDGRGTDGVVLPLACLFISSGLLRCLRAGVRFSILCRVRCRDVCGELDETARVPMIGWRRFSFSRHLVFDTG